MTSQQRSVNPVAKLCGLDVGVKSYSAALVENTKIMLRNNYLLERVVLKRLENGIWLCLEDDEISFLLKANKLGRGQLFMNQGKATKDVTWMDLFEATEGKLDNIFYLVRSHPNEFAQMGLADAAEKMSPMTQSLKVMLCQNRKETEKSMQDMICQNGEEMELRWEAMLRQNKEEMEKSMQSTSHLNRSTTEHTLGRYESAKQRGDGEVNAADDPPKQRQKGTTLGEKCMPCMIF